MTGTRKFEISIIVVALLAVVVSPRPAQAYLDPGNGSYFLQVGLAVILGGLVAIRAYFTRIKHALARFFTRRKSEPTE